MLNQHPESLTRLAHARHEALLREAAQDRAQRTVLLLLADY
jgi:hypothetical protein